MKYLFKKPVCKLPRIKLKYADTYVGKLQGTTIHNFTQNTITFIKSSETNFPLQWCHRTLSYGSVCNSE